MIKQALNLLPSLLKLVLASIIMVMSMAAFIANINQANAAIPKRNVTITGDNITLGDVFDEIYKNEDYVLAPAPHPNAPITWDAYTLNRIAKAFKLNWRPSSQSDKITINRLATVVQPTDIQNAILDHLGQDNILTQNLELEFVGADPTIILPHEINPTIMIKNASYNADRQTFSASVQTADGQLFEYKGVGHKMVSVPVLRTVIRRGDSIKRSMITMHDIRENSVTEDMVLRVDELVGMTPRKILRANEPVQLSQLNKPVMVKRGDLVTMQLSNGPIAITALAKAMESGTKGDIIRLVNMDSKRTLEAQITGLREASVFN